MRLPARKFANFGLFFRIYPATLTAGVTADKEASMTTTAESPAAARLEGKIAEAWEVYDKAGMWRQLGVTPPVSANALRAVSSPRRARSVSTTRLASSAADTSRACGAASAVSLRRA